MIVSSTARALASFRDANEPRALASRLVATAAQHPRGWTLSLPGGQGSVEAATFEGAVSALVARTGLTRLLIVWAVGGGDE
jgi:hypothetical protein